jgi:hypothetical protein
MIGEIELKPQWKQNCTSNSDVLLNTGGNLPVCGDYFINWRILLKHNHPLFVGLLG